MFKSFIGKLQKKALLGVNYLRFDRADVEELVVKMGDVLLEEI
jgi:hypothetical protein